MELLLTFLPEIFLVFSLKQLLSVLGVLCTLLIIDMAGLLSAEYRVSLLLQSFIRLATLSRVTQSSCTKLSEKQRATVRTRTLLYKIDKDIGKKKQT